MYIVDELVIVLDKNCWQAKNGHVAQEATVTEGWKNVGDLEQISKRP